jgi:hypothetical protein
MSILLAMAAVIASVSGASAQTRNLGIAPLAEQSTAVEKRSSMAKVRIWTRARWEAARRHWTQDNAKFFACSGKWREQVNGRKYSLHDQREFLFQCMSDAKSTGLRLHGDLHAPS